MHQNYLLWSYKHAGKLSYLFCSKVKCWGGGGQQALFTALYMYVLHSTRETMLRLFADFKIIRSVSLTTKLHLTKVYFQISCVRGYILLVSTVRLYSSLFKYWTTPAVAILNYTAQLGPRCHLK